MSRERRDHMYQYSRQVLEEISASLKDEHPAQIVSIYAFGSRARGDHSGDSDFDVLVVVRNKTIQLEEKIIARFVEKELASGVSFEPVIKSLESYEREKQYRTLFYENIVNEGIQV